MESENGLRLALIGDLEIVSGQVGDRLAVSIERYRIEADQRARAGSLCKKRGRGQCKGADNS